MEKSFLLRSLLSLYFLTGDYEICTKGMVTVSPTPVAPVCRVGDPLELTCSSSGNFSRWAFRVSNEQGVSQEYRRNINTQDGSEQVSMINVNSTTFTFMRTSSQGMLPLVSTLVIDSVSRYLNGTEVHCLDVATTKSASTTIRLFDDNNPARALGPTAIITSEEFGSDNVTITVEWTLEEGATYQIIVVPQISINFTGGSSIQLILPYNINYNLSLETALPCHQTHSYVRLFYANCGYPLLSADNESKPNVTYSDLPIQGATVNFTCPTDLVLSGSDIATCMGNGEWDPDPQQLECINIIFNCDAPSPPSNGYIDSYNHTAEGLAVNFACTNRTTCICPHEMEATQNVVLHTAVCLLDGRWEPNLEDFCQKYNIITKSSSDINAITVILATLVAVLLISNAFLFTVGYVCGLRCKKMDTQPATLHDIVHEDQELQSTGVDEQELELESNVAYGHFQRN